MTNKTTPIHVTEDLYDETIIDTTDATNIIIQFKQNGNIVKTKTIAIPGSIITITKT